MMPRLCLYMYLSLWINRRIVLQQSYLMEHLITTNYRIQNTYRQMSITLHVHVPAVRIDPTSQTICL